MEKPCRECGETKRLSEFGRHITGSDGHRNICKKCQSYTAKKLRKPKEKYITSGMDFDHPVYHDFIKGTFVR